MHRHSDTLQLSATDLASFLGCRHRTALDLAVTEGKRERPRIDDPVLEILQQRGIEHEQRYVAQLRAQGRDLKDLGSIEKFDDRARATEAALRAGADVVVQGALGQDSWRGYPDVMLRVDRPSAFGEWSYEIADTKLSRTTRAGTILQLALYSDMLEALQGVRPEWFHVVTPDVAEPVKSYRVDDFAAYFRLTKRQMADAVALGSEQLAAMYYPEPVDHCDVCHWSGECARRRRKDDHLSLVAGISRVQRRELEAQSVETLTSLASLPVPLAFRPRRGSKEGYVRVREQARVQLASRDQPRPVYEMLDVVEGRGVCLLPEPSPGDLFLDLEGDPLAVGGGREYLFGLAAADGSYRSAWAFDDAAEKDAFEWVIDTIVEAIREHPTMHVYHYAPYEPAALKRLMGRYATRGRELDAMLREGRFVDLYAVVRQGLRVGVERYSIKSLEPLYDFTRDVDLKAANRSLSAIEFALESGATDAVPREVRDSVEGYNRDDCVSTLRLRDWLERLRGSLVAQGTSVPRRTLEDGEAPAEVDERAERVEALRAKLLAGVPELRADRSPEQHARWLLAYMLDYHRREQRVVWWEYFALRDMDDEELLDERHAVAGLERVERVDVVRNKRTGKPTGSVIDRYRYPPQDMELDVGDELRVRNEDTVFGKVIAVDRQQRTIDVRKGPQTAELVVSAVFAFTHVSTESIEESLMRIGEAVVSGRRDDAVHALLTRQPPRLTIGTLDPAEGESESALAIRVAGALDRTVLAIQGPPGSGKTYTGARMIAALVRQGKRVGVTATSHAVIRNLLDAVAEAADEVEQEISLAHKGGDDGDDVKEDDRIRRLASNEEAAEVLRNGEANVVGGTAWLWARPEMEASVDVLFVDEAGQMALPNVVAVAPAANSIVLLGDPQQLEQPRRGAHPDGVGVSALEHVLDGARTIGSGRGIFLPVTRRLAPAICKFTSEIFYDGRLKPLDGLERQRLAGVEGLPASGLCMVPVDHDGNRNASDEEVEAVARLVERLTASGATWTDGKGCVRPMTHSNILIVAPYNAHVSRLEERLADTGVRVGTVDRFQGQEEAVAIYAMATSRPEDAPRGMEFLYSLNRLNVATSRARCLAIVVASPRLFEPECRSPAQMRLANGLCRLRELATEVRI